MPWWCRGLLLYVLVLTAGCAAWPGAARPLPAPGTVYAPPSLAPLSPEGLTRRLGQTQVLLVGEVHDHPGHHQVQLDLLKAMADLEGPLVVGVEWLEWPAQEACDQFSAGGLSVADFAQKVNWSERWGFPLELYAPILEFVRQRRLPLLALNAPLEAVRQVARQGLDSLSPQQRALLAPALDLDDPAYRRQMAAQFAMHGMGRGPSQENFFVAQVARDETMAHRLALALAPWPDGGKRAVVLAGGGHLSHGQGLPTRLARRLPGARLTTVLAMPAEMAPGPHGASWQGQEGPPPADLLVVATPAPPAPPRLGVVLTPREDGLLIERVLPQTPAQVAGLVAGDLLTAMDGRPLRQAKDIHDIIKADPRAPHELGLRRKGRELRLTITLQGPGE